MPSRASQRRPAMYNTPAIRTGGFGALQVEAITNRPLSIARRHLAASQLRMRDIEPDELSSSEWVRFLVMEARERERWIADFQRRRRDRIGSASSSSSSSSSPVDMDVPPDRQTAYDKAEEARLEAEESQRMEQEAVAPPISPAPRPVSSVASSTGSTPFVSLWARHLDEQERNERTDTAPSSYSARRPMHARHSVDAEEPPPAYNTLVRSGSPPPAYQPRREEIEDGAASPTSRMRRWSSQYLPSF